MDEDKNLIDFDDIPDKPEQEPTKQNQEDRVKHLPPELRARARQLAPGLEYTVLGLKEEGTGHNESLVHVASKCFKMGVSFDDTLEHLQELYASDRMDYETAPLRAVKRVWLADGDLGALTDDDGEAAPDEKEELLFRFRRTPDVSIVEASPEGFEAFDPWAVVNRLFEPTDIINIQHSSFEYGTLSTVEDLPALLMERKEQLHDYHFLNPATFKKVEGVPNPLHPEKKVSTRCNANVKTRDYMVLEMDTKDESRRERFNTFAMTMGQFAPLIVAVDTGGKSVHFWFDFKGAPDGAKVGFFNLACMHGADKRLGVKSQIARMPGALTERDGRGKQSIIYFDPDGENTPDGWDLKGFEQFLLASQQLDFYYHGQNKSFMTRDNLETWIALDRTSVRSHLCELGYRDNKTDGERIAPLDAVINAIQMDKNVEAVVPGASGRHAGIYEENGHRIIVTKSPTFIKARRGGWPTIGAFLDGLLGHEPGQLEVFYGWLQHAVRCLRNNGRRQAIWAPAQMLHVMGPPNAGKTLLLQDILKPAFANRVADASPLFKRIPDMHNADTFGCELLFLDDSPVLETNYAFRAEFGERIKSHIVGIGGGIRDMRQSRINIRPWWRFVRLMNMEPTTFATLPPLEEGVEDKLILLRGEDMLDGPLGAEMRVPGWYDRVKSLMEEEMPAFIHFLMYEYEVPEEYKDPKQRFPVCSFKDPQILRDVNEGSPEAAILYKIDTDAKNDLFVGDAFAEDGDKQTPWQGSSEALYDKLSVSGSRAAQHRFVKTCPSPRILISQLRKIEKTHPHRVGYSRRLDGYKDRINNAEYWVIFPEGYDEPNYEQIELEDLL